MASTRAASHAPTTATTSTGPWTRDSSDGLGGPRMAPGFRCRPVVALPGRATLGRYVVAQVSSADPDAAVTRRTRSSFGLATVDGPYTDTLIVAGSASIVVRTDLT
jgi:hypothetical protein